MTTIAPPPRSPSERRRRAITSLVFVTGLTIAALAFAPDWLSPWMKAVHVMAIISWMAGMLYLPRLFVYHTQVPIGSPSSELFKVMERRLLEAIMNPAMVVSWVIGLWLAWTSFRFVGGWLHAKIALAIALSAIHGYLAAGVRAFAEDRNKVSERNWRIINEMPALLMVGIVILVIVKPF